MFAEIIFMIHSENWQHWVSVKIWNLNVNVYIIWRFEMWTWNKLIKDLQYKLALKKLQQRNMYLSIVIRFHRSVKYWLEELLEGILSIHSRKYFFRLKSVLHWSKLEYFAATGLSLPIWWLTKLAVTGTEFNWKNHLKHNLKQQWYVEIWFICSTYTSPNHLAY